MVFGSSVFYLCLQQVTLFYTPKKILDKRSGLYIKLDCRSEFISQGLGGNRTTQKT
jgi:hypothetical protein